VHLDDLLTRRTRISIEAPHRGTESARPVAELVAPVLGWDERRVRREVEAYSARVAAERASQEEDDDLAADATRLAASDLRDVEAVGARSG
jgi:glycerol-3-phosphate dehydrogenase